MKRQQYILILLFIITCGSCKRVLDLEPLDKSDGNAMFSDPEGVKLYMANLYYQMPVEDFNFMRWFQRLDRRKYGYRPFHR